MGIGVLDVHEDEAVNLPSPPPDSPSWYTPPLARKLF